MKILILGISGMLGSSAFQVFARSDGFDVIGTARDKSVTDFFAADLRGKIVTGVDVLQENAMSRIFEQVNPDLVINCVGLIKQLATANDPLVVLPINSMFPHQLAALCDQHSARLIHISTDCVFDGKKGGYLETDISNASDLYGKSKFIGELSDKPHAITLRTSIIGHELNSSNGLIEWFLSQTGSIRGFKRAIFSGLPTVELTRVIRDYVIPRPELSGLYHVSADPISKFDLLSLVAEIYGIDTKIIPDNEFVIDRSLNSELFQSVTGYRPPAWPELVRSMKKSKMNTGI